MAKRVSDQTVVPDRAKVRVIFAEVEGNNESVQEALRTMVSAMSRPVKIVSEPRLAENGASLLGQAEASIDEEAAQHVEEVEAPSDAQPSNSERAPRGSGKKIDRNAGLQLVPNLNFRLTGEKSFKDFVSEKDPKNDVDVVLLALYYMQHVMKLQKIGPNHLMTAFKEVGKPIPLDLKQTIRNVMNRKMFLNFSDIDDIRTTTQGDNVVEHEMGKSG